MIIEMGSVIAYAPPRSKKDAEPRLRVVAPVVAPAADTDTHLIRRFQRTGEHACFTTLMERHGDKVRRLLYTLLGGAVDEIPDVEQEVALALWRALDVFQFRSSFSTYLYRVCCNTAYSYVRRTRRIRAVTRFDEELHADRSDHRRASSTPAEDMQLRHQREVVCRALRRLKPDDRLIIHLREFEGHSTEKCAAILQCPIGTVKSKLHRAKKKLAYILEEVYEKL